MTEAVDATACEIRPVATTAEYRACEGLQLRAWGFASERDVVPLTQLLAAHKAGGLVLGAFAPGGRLVGFVYGFLGRDEDGWFHHSHMTAVDPAWQGCGLGARLKWAQRERVLAQGIERIAWTYDPLESRNACFNFDKLGVVARTYWPDLYGETTSRLHRGMPTDRLRAEWFLASARVCARAAGRRSALARRLREQPDAFPTALRAAAGARAPRPERLEVDPGAATLLCEIPGEIQEVKRLDAEAALAWRLETRALLQGALARGYHVRECVRTRTRRPRTLYLLAKGSPELAD